MTINKLGGIPVKNHIVALLLLAAISFSLVGCGQKVEPERPEHIIFVDKEVKRNISRLPGRRIAQI